jgi:hypothetical protein
VSAATVPATIVVPIATIITRAHHHGPLRFRVRHHHPRGHGLGKFASIVDGQDPHNIVLRVAGVATGMWSVEVLFDRIYQMYLHNG